MQHLLPSIPPQTLRFSLRVRTGMVPTASLHYLCYLITFPGQLTVHYVSTVVSTKSKSQILTCADSETSHAVGFEPSLIPCSDLVFMGVQLQTFEETSDGTIQPTFARVLGFWVKNQTLTPLSDFYSKSTLPQSLFPFSRLASIVPANSSDFFIYHQLNASNFGEERWDDSLNGWTSTSFEISMA